MLCSFHFSHLEIFFVVFHLSFCFNLAQDASVGGELRRASETVGEEERRLPEREARVMGAVARAWIPRRSRPPLFRPSHFT